MEAILKIQKLGNGLGINIPPVIVNRLALREGLYVNVQGSGNKIIIEPSKPNATYSLADMLNEITESNLHLCVETGVPIGNETW
jgi:antitoxin component of MazEF toxin-antitoxin module